MDGPGRRDRRRAGARRASSRRPARPVRRAGAGGAQARPGVGAGTRATSGRPRARERAPQAVAGVGDWGRPADPDPVCVRVRAAVRPRPVARGTAGNEGGAAYAHSHCLGAADASQGGSTDGYTNTVALGRTTSANHHPGTGHHRQRELDGQDGRGRDAASSGRFEWRATRSAAVGDGRDDPDRRRIARAEAHLAGRGGRLVPWIGSIWLENAYPTAPLKTFFENTWKALTMFFFDNGEIWVHSIPHRPALDWISAAIFFIGFVVVVNVIFRNKKMDYLFILISILILMLPSIMSLAFPSENPSLNRTAAAYIPVFVIIGIGFSWIIENLTDRHTIKNIKISGVLVSTIIAAALTLTNYRLIFIDYAAQFNKNSWNTSEIGELIVKKVALGMNESNIYVVPYPHWVDTRLVGINAGYPLRDFALQEEDFKASTEKKGEKLYILKPEDDLHLTQFISMLVDPRIQLFESKIEGKNFLILTGN